MVKYLELVAAIALFVFGLMGLGGGSTLLMDVADGWDLGAGCIGVLFGACCLAGAYMIASHI